MAKLSILTYLVTQTSLSRRNILDLLKRGEIFLNGCSVSHREVIVDSSRDKVAINREVIPYTTPLLYYKLNKPKGIICSLSDERGRKDLRSIIEQISASLFPVGRLDRESQGLLLLTNDGEWAHALLHPAFEMVKIYRVILEEPVKKSVLRRLLTGFFLSDGPVRFDAIEIETPTIVKVAIHEGRNRIIRRAFEHVDYPIKSLKRVSIGPIELGKLRDGQWKPLTAKEVAIVSKHGAVAK